MATEHIESFEVVIIGSGERFTPPYMIRDDFSGVIGFLQGGLKKDGTPKAYAGSNQVHVVPEADTLTKSDEREIFRRGHTNVYPYYAARVDEQREAVARGIRAHIQVLEEELRDRRQALIDLYTVFGEKDAGA